VKSVNALAKRIESLSAIAFVGNGFRSTSIRYANGADLLSGKGSMIHGGRWNPPGVRAIYFALDPLTAVQESFAVAESFGFALKHLTPRVLVCVQLALKPVVDLSNPAVRNTLKLTKQSLIQDDWLFSQHKGLISPTQQIGKVLLEASLEGMIVPSAAAPKRRNIVVFPENLSTESKLEIVGAEDLPKTAGFFSLV
jgi:RES domain-containing protein